MRIRPLLKTLPQSFAGIDYQPLQDLLAAEQWEAADQLTHQLILQIAGRDDQWLRKVDIFCLPGADLKIIDRLWRAYSAEEFGFTIQCQRWEDRRFGAQQSSSFYEQTREKLEYFASNVGWLVSPDPAKLKYNFMFERNETVAYVSAPYGHLPSTFALGGGKLIQLDPGGAWSSGKREQDALVGKEFIECFLERLQTVLDVPDGKDFPSIPIDRLMNRRQGNEKIKSEPEAIALLDNLPQSLAGIDYQPLHDLLAAGKWQQANRLTRQIILGLVDRQGYWLRYRDIENLPLSELEIIDRLWRAYSNCRFGFTIQRHIWYDSYAKNTPKGYCARIEPTMKEFGLRVGWDVTGEYRYEDNRNQDWVFGGDVIADASAPVGHLPTTYDLGGGEIVKHETYEPHPDDAVMGFLGSSYTMTKREKGHLLGDDLLRDFFRRIAEIE